MERPHRVRTAARSTIALVLSALVHLFVVCALFVIPYRLKSTTNIIDMELVVPAVPGEPVPEPPLPEPPLPEPVLPEPVQIANEKPRVSPVKREEPEPEPESEPVPEPESEPVPPVFDLNDNSFAQAEGQDAAWALNRSEGNTLLAGVASGNGPSVREKAPSPDVATDGGKSPFSPVSKKNWSRRPEPKGQGAAVPAYPPQARRDGIEGKVKLQVYIGRDGRVKKVHVLADPGGGLGKAAENAMLQQRWEPALDKVGNAVDTIIAYTYTFVLQ